MPTAKGWSRAFDDPIELPDGRTLRTLADAGHYIAALPKAMQQRPEIQPVPILGGLHHQYVRI
jgi:hypothetical protein